VLQNRPHPSVDVGKHGSHHSAMPQARTLAERGHQARRCGCSNLNCVRQDSDAPLQSAPTRRNVEEGVLYALSRRRRVHLAEGVDARDLADMDADVAAHTAFAVHADLDRGSLARFVSTHSRRMKCR
jgi:hypothetical protein